MRLVEGSPSTLRKLRKSLNRCHWAQAVSGQWCLENGCRWNVGCTGKRRAVESQSCAILLSREPGENLERAEESQWGGEVVKGRCGRFPRCRRGCRCGRSCYGATGAAALFPPRRYWLQGQCERSRQRSFSFISDIFIVSHMYSCPLRSWCCAASVDV